jgi:hypothetical protein
VFLIRIQPR